MASKSLFVCLFLLWIVIVTHQKKTRGFITDSCYVWEKHPDERWQRETECVFLCLLDGKQLQLVPVEWMRNTACSLISCFLEYCHPDVQHRPLVGEGWVAASPLRGLFLQGHTHAWSEAHRGGSGTRRLYLLCLTPVTPHGTSYRSENLMTWVADSKA